MKYLHIFLTILGSILLVLVGEVGLSQAQSPGPLSQENPGKGFTYQGQLGLNGEPVNATCDFQFGLYDAATLGNQIGSTQIENLTVTDGLFSVLLNDSAQFGSDAFAGDARWLEISVQCSGETSYTHLGRQALTAAPYADYAHSTGALRGLPVTTTAPLAGQVLKWNGGAWGPAHDDGHTYNAGFGLSLTDQTFAVVTNTVQARVTGVCGVGSAMQQINVDGTVICVSGNGTAYTAGTGLVLSGTQFALGGTFRLPQACAGGQVAKWNGTAWVCASDSNTTYTAGTGLVLSGDQFALNGTFQLPQACAGNQVAKWDGKAWVCAPDNGTTYTAGTGMVLSGTQFALNGTFQLPQTCASNQMVKWDGTGWVCASNTSAGDHGALTGLDGDDHPQYFNLSQDELVASTPAFNGGTSGVSAPFSVDSTMMVTDLNADLLDGQHGSAFADSTHDHDASYVNEAQADSITSAMLVDGAVTSDDLADGATLAEILDDDGTGSTLDADLLDGQHGSAFADSTHDHDATYVNETQANSITSAMLVDGAVASDDLADGATLAEILDDDGTGSTLDADLLDGQHGSAFADSTHDHDASYVNEAQADSITSAMLVDGAVTSDDLADGATLAEILDDDGTGSTLDADLLDGQHGSAFATSTHDHDATYWMQGGNSFGVASTLGTNDAYALELEVNGSRVLRLEPDSTSPNLIGGYSDNWLTSGVYGAVIAGGGYSGQANRVTDPYGVIGGGYGNQAGLDDGTLEWNNSVATVGGGWNNTASHRSATIAGGWKNTASGEGASIAGGYNNVASGSWTMIPGGESNLAAGYASFAAGRMAKANQDGCFVWGDSYWEAVTCDTTDAWVARATGGVTFYTNRALTTGVQVAAGGGSWASVSDRNLKANFQPVDGPAVLEQVAALPISTWNYISQDASIRHMGPMAQDFYAAFGVGEDDTHITTIDADGVALAAIQGLHAENQELQAEVESLRQQNNDLEARLTALEKADESRSPLAMLSGSWWLLGGVVATGGAVAGYRLKRGDR